MDIAELLAFSVKHNASDLHLSAGLPPMIRVDGDIRRINVPVLDHKTVHELVYDIMNDKQRKDYEEFFEVDFSFEIPGLRVSGSTPSTRIAAPRRCSARSRRRS
jgi:twitching motility protein PilT